MSLVDLQLALGNCGTADAVESIAPGNEITVDLMAFAFVPIVDLRLRIVIINAHGLRFKMDGCLITKARGDQILDDFLLRINGDGFANQILKINAMALSIEAKFDPLMLQALSLQALAHSGTRENVHRALLQHAGTHTSFHVFARVSFQNYGFNTLKVQEVSQRQTRRSGADDPDLCAEVRHCG